MAETAENLCLGFGCRGKGFFAKVSNYVFGNHGLGGLLKEGSHGKSPKYLGGNLGDFAKLSNR
ncbi:MAG: hypothetical protein KH936_09460 [Neisseria sp.]|nr:hypothetical protein [Neisseria sp.]